MSAPTRRLCAAGDERGSTIVLIIGYFIVAGLMLIAGVIASAAFLAQRELQAACDGAAIAAADGLDRGATGVGGIAQYDGAAANTAVSEYLLQTWGSEAALVGFQVSAAGGEVVVVCTKLAHVPFEDLISPGGIEQTVSAAADAPLVG